MISAKFSSTGSHLQYQNVQLPCFLLEDGQSVFDKAGIQKAMGYSGKSGDWLFEFMQNLDRYAKIPIEILESLADATEFSAGKEKKSAVTPKTLMSACKIILKAKENGFLYLSEEKYAKAAASILEMFERHDPTALVHFASGFDAYKLNFKEAVGRILNADCGPFSNWIKSFSDNDFEFLLDLHDREWTDRQGIPEVADAILDLIFLRLDADLLEILQNTPPKRFHAKQFRITRYGNHPELEKYLDEIRKIYNDTGGKENTFRLLLDKIHPRKRSAIRRTQTASPSADGGFTEIVKKVIDN